ncbi:MAG: putative cell survival pathways protein [Chaenotheca gracillima]|nr:MAG: putative cell survival pathways protein [Chaenotheca gracillima]
MARRGGVKRISGAFYDEARLALKNRLQMLLRDVVTFTEHQQRRTVTVTDVIFALKRIGNPIYGFDKDTYKAK